MIGLVAPPRDHRTLNGGWAAERDMDLRVRLMFMGLLHESIAGTGSSCLAAASRVEGSVVGSVARERSGDVLLMGHPSGITPAKVKARRIGEAPFVEFEALGFSRTARRLMECVAYYPRSTFDGIEERAAGRGRENESPGVEAVLESEVSASARTATARASTWARARPCPVARPPASGLQPRRRW
jgi:PrpF protein